MKLEQKIAKILVKKRKTLSVAESCSGGLLAHRLTNIPGSSRFFQLGVVVYSNVSKIRLLGVPQRSIAKYGAVSPEVAQDMAKGIRKLVDSDLGVSITGIAGPTGATKDKPIGLVYIAVSTREHVLCLKSVFRGRRTQIKNLAVTKALRFLLKSL